MKRFVILLPLLLVASSCAVFVTDRGSAPNIHLSDWHDLHPYVAPPPDQQCNIGDVVCIERVAAGRSVSWCPVPDTTREPQANGETVQITSETRIYPCPAPDFSPHLTRRDVLYWRLWALVHGYGWVGR